MASKWPQNWGPLNGSFRPQKWAKNPVSRGYPGKMTENEKRRGNFRGIFRVFFQKNGVFDDFLGSVIKRGTSIALRLVDIVCVFCLVAQCNGPRF